IARVPPAARRVVDHDVRSVGAVLEPVQRGAVVVRGGGTAPLFAASPQLRGARERGGVGGRLGAPAVVEQVPDVEGQAYHGTQRDDRDRRHHEDLAALAVSLLVYTRRHSARRNVQQPCPPHGAPETSAGVDRIGIVPPSPLRRPPCRPLHYCAEDGTRNVTFAARCSAASPSCRRAYRSSCRHTPCSRACAGPRCATPTDSNATGVRRSSRWRSPSRCSSSSSSAPSTSAASTT